MQKESNSESVKPLLSIDQVKGLLINFSDWYYAKDDIDPPYGFETLVDMYLSEKVEEYARKEEDKSQSVKPLLSAEDILRELEVNDPEWKFAERADAFMVRKIKHWKDGAKRLAELASQLKTSSPQLEQEKVCPKCGHGMTQWPKWKDWQEKLLPILTRFADQSVSAYHYGDVWNAIRKLIVGPMESRIKELEQQLSQSDTLEEGQK